MTGPDYGYFHGVNSGESAAFNNAGYPAQFSAPQNFALVSGYFTAAVANGTVANVRAWNDGVLVGSVSFTLYEETREHIVFNSGFSDIDRVVITGRVSSGSQVNVVMDDLELRLPGGDGDRIEVGPGTDVAALIAAAQDDGFGNAVLRHATGSLTLASIAAVDIRDHWFVTAGMETA